MKSLLRPALSALALALPLMASAADFTVTCKEGAANSFDSKSYGPLTVSFDGQTLTTTRTTSDGSKSVNRTAVARAKTLPASMPGGMSIALVLSNRSTRDETVHVVLTFEGVAGGTFTEQTANISSDGVFVGATDSINSRKCTLR